MRRQPLKFHKTLHSRALQQICFILQWRKCVCARPNSPERARARKFAIVCGTLALGRALVPGTVPGLGTQVPGRWPWSLGPWLLGPCERRACCRRRARGERG